MHATWSVRLCVPADPNLGSVQMGQPPPGPMTFVNPPRLYYVTDQEDSNA
jgi:hypothetical protein